MVVVGQTVSSMRCLCVLSSGNNTTFKQARDMVWLEGGLSVGKLLMRLIASSDVSKMQCCRYLIILSFRTTTRL